MAKNEKEAYYFSHDSNARNDTKVLRLRRTLGIEGYGIYFCIIEMLREQSGYKMPLADIPEIAFDLHTDEAKVKSVVNDFNLFDIDGEYFTSPRLQRSMEKYNERKTKLSEAGRKGAKARLNQPLSPPKAKNEPNKSVAMKPKQAPRFEDVHALFVRNGKTEADARKFYDHYDGVGWMQGITPIINWSAFANKWISNQFNNNNSTQPVEPQKDFNKEFADLVNRKKKP